MYDQNFCGGGGGWRGGSSEGCFKWGGGGGSLRDLSRNISKQGVGKAKVVRRGGGSFEGVATPASPQKILIIHYGCLF